MGEGGGGEALTDSLGGGVPPLIDFVSHKKISKLLSYHHRIRFLGKIIGTTNSPTFTFLLGLPAQKDILFKTPDSEIVYPVYDSRP